MVKSKKVQYHKTKFSDQVIFATTTKSFGDVTLNNAVNIISLSRLLNIAPEKTARVRQIHSNIIVEAKTTHYRNILIADGLFTAEKGVYLTVKTADCVPLLFYSKKPRMLMLLHAGRVGLEKGIIKRGLEIMDQKKVKRKDLQVYAGPFIKRNCYPTDLWRIIKQQLQERGVMRENISAAQYCTFCHKDLYFSYRRGDVERMATIAYIL